MNLPPCLPATFPPSLTTSGACSAAPQSVFMAWFSGLNFEGWVGRFQSVSQNPTRKPRDTDCNMKVLGPRWCALEQGVQTLAISHNRQTTIAVHALTTIRRAKQTTFECIPSRPDTPNKPPWQRKFAPETTDVRREASLLLQSALKQMLCAPLFRGESKGCPPSAPQASSSSCYCART